MTDLIKESAKYLNTKTLRQGSNQHLVLESKPKGYKIRYQTIGMVYHKDPKSGNDKIYTSKSAAEDDIRTLRTSFYQPFAEEII